MLNSCCQCLTRADCNTQDLCVMICWCGWSKIHSSDRIKPHFKPETHYRWPIWMNLFLFCSEWKYKLSQWCVLIPRTPFACLCPFRYWCYSPLQWYSVKYLSSYLLLTDGNLPNSHPLNMIKIHFLWTLHLLKSLCSNAFNSSASLVKDNCLEFLISKPNFIQFFQSVLE